MAAAIVRPPNLRTSEQGRSSSWLELFFDLVFVLAVTQLGLALAGDLSLRGFGRFGLLFVPVWWAWVGFTNYADRFDSDDLVFRLLLLTAMLGICVVAIAVPDTFRQGSAVFAAAYAAVRALLLVLYARARRHVPEARALCNVTMSVFVVGTSLWVISLAVPEPARFALWGAALLIEGATPWVARRAMSAVPYHASHLPERYGLFTLIVLGESLVAIALGIHTTNWNSASILSAALGFVCVAALWWLYFDSIESSGVRRTLFARNAFIYGHLLIAVGLAATAVGVKQAILLAAQSSLPAGARWALCGGSALFLLATSAVRLVATHRLGERTLSARGAACALILVAAALGAGLAPVALVAVLAALLTACAGADLSRHDAAVD